MLKLYTVGNKILNSQGKQVILRGVNFESGEWSNPGFHKEDWYSEMESWGANLIRLPFNPNWISDQNYLSWLDNCVNWAEKHNLYEILDMHAVPSRTPEGYPGDALFLDTWEVLANRYKNRNHIMCGVFNEVTYFSDYIWPDGVTGGWGYGGTASNAVWTKDMPAIIRKAIDRIRLISDQIITVPGAGIPPSWGQNHNNWIVDPLTQKNIVHDCHFYVNWTSQVATNEGIDQFLIDNGINTLSKTRPILIGEIGAKSETTQYEWLQMALNNIASKGYNFTLWCMTNAAGFEIVQNAGQNPPNLTPTPAGLTLQKFLPPPTPKSPLLNIALPLIFGFASLLIVRRG